MKTLKKHGLLILAMAAALVLWIGAACEAIDANAQDQPAPAPHGSLVIPKQEQKDQLDISIRDGSLIIERLNTLKAQMESLQAQFQIWQAKDNALVETIKKDNNWGEDIKFDPQRRAFYKEVPKEQPKDTKPAKH